MLHYTILLATVKFSSLHVHGYCIQCGYPNRRFRYHVWHVTESLHWQMIDVDRSFCPFPPIYRLLDITLGLDRYLARKVKSRVADHLSISPKSRASTMNNYYPLGWGRWGMKWNIEQGEGCWNILIALPSLETFPINWCTTRNAITWRCM